MLDNMHKVPCGVNPGDRIHDAKFKCQGIVIRAEWDRNRSVTRLRPRRCSPKCEKRVTVVEPGSNLVVTKVRPSPGGSRNNPRDLPKGFFAYTSIVYPRRPTESGE